MTNKYKESIHYCRVCGLYHEDPPWGYDNKTASHDICSCCGTEFGYEDCNLKSIRQMRQRWIAEGTHWFEPKRKPENWNLEEQLKNIPLKYQ